MSFGGQVRTAASQLLPLLVHQTSLPAKQHLPSLGSLIRVWPPTDPSANRMMSSSQSAPSPPPPPTTTRQPKLQGRVAVVTGSTEGIGYAVANRLAEDGAKVVVSSRKQDNVSKAVQELRAKFGSDRVAGIVCHVGNPDDRERLLNFTVGKFGAIDILVSNVAANPYFGNLLDTPESAWDKIFEINVKAPFMLTQQTVPHMLKNNRLGDNGAIIYISSIAGYMGMQAIGAYSISKTALLGLCKTTSMELAQEGIRVNLVAPGIIKTKFSSPFWTEDEGDNAGNEFYLSSTHLKRLGEPQELGGIVSFLASPDASYITGENIVVAGGYHCAL